MPLLGVDESDRTFVSVPAAVVAVCAALLLGFGVAMLVADDGGRPTARPAGAGSSACEEALRRAEAALGAADQVDDALAEHTVVVNDLLAARIDARQAGERAAPLLTAGSQHSVDLDIAAQQYQAAAQECRGEGR